jgi:hypothetical protein
MTMPVRTRRRKDCPKQRRWLDGGTRKRSRARSAARKMRAPRRAEEEMKPASVGVSKARFYEPTCSRALLYDTCMIDTFH